jgi:arylsulfatase A-like enzyme
MITRTFTLVLLVCALAASALIPSPFLGATAQTRPNFIVIIADDLDSASIKHMPAVNRLLVQQGTTFSRYFATTPLCCPSRASLLRGQYAHNHGVLRNTGDDAGFDAFVASGHESVTMATLFDAAGYQTALVGKYLNGYASRDDQTYVPPGWDYWASGVDHAAYDGFGYELNVNGELVRHGHDDADYMTDVLAGHAQEFLSGAVGSGDPFLLYLAPYAPHSPSTPAPRHGGQFAGATAPRTPAFNERNVRDKPDWVRSTPRMTESRIAKIDSDYRRRLESLQAVDEMVEAVTNQLEQAGKLDSTYFLFLSDNGYFMGEQRQPHGKDAPYDAASRIPLIVRGPGVPANATVDALALNIDLLPTLLGLAGLSVPSFVDGRSLLPLLTGDSRDWRQIALLEGFGKETENLEGTESSTPPFRALRGADVLYVEYETGERELYNLRKDPYQLSNLAQGAEKSTLRPFSRQLGALATCIGPACQAVENASPPRITDRNDGSPRDTKRSRARGERKRPPKTRSAPPARTTPFLEIAESDNTIASLSLSLTPREARSRQLQLRVHVASVASPGILVAAVDLPESGDYERLSSAPVRGPGWLTLNLAGALGDTRHLSIVLHGRDGVALALSAPGSSQPPELVAGDGGRADTPSRHRGQQSRASRQAGDDHDRPRRGDRARRR